MCWLDRTSVRTILKLRDRFGLDTFVETGAAEGNSAIFYAQHFPRVISCETNTELYFLALERLHYLKNVAIWRLPSPEFLARFNQLSALYFLDAHSPVSWPIREELMALRGNTRCCLVIHDFKVPTAGLGYLSYEGQDLDLDYIREPLMAVNPSFHLYHNLRSDVVTLQEAEAGVPGVLWDKHTERVLKYAWSSSWRTQRGILYAVPQELDEAMLEVKRWTWD